MKYKTKKNYWKQDISKTAYIQAFLQGVILLLVISYLFYGTILGAILLSPYLIRYMKSWEKQMLIKKKQAFQLQFREAIRSMSSALNVGYSVENAMREAFRDLQLLYEKNDYIMKEFCYMIRQLEMNLPVENIWKEFAVRVEDEEVRLFVTVFTMAKRSGGDTIRIIRSAVEQIGEKIEVKREIDTMMTAKRLEFRIMSMVPIVMICYLKASFSGFVNVLYGNAFGVIFMTVCLAIYAGAYELGKHIVEIEV